MHTIPAPQFYTHFTGQLEREKKESGTVHQSISRLQHEMSRLSTVITEKRGEQQRLEQSNVLMQNDFIYTLKVLYYKPMHMYCICMYLYVLTIAQLAQEELPQVGFELTMVLDALPTELLRQLSWQGAHIQSIAKYITCICIVAHTSSVSFSQLCSKV